MLRIGLQQLKTPSTVRHFTTIRPVSPMTALRASYKTPQLESPTASPILSSLAAATPSVSLLSIFGLGQRRWKSRGNTFQPNTYKRKQRVGFLARMRSKTGRRIITRRKQKGRWYLSY